MRENQKQNEAQSAQHTRELTSARNTSHKHNNKDLSRLWSLSPGMRVNTRYTNSTRSTSEVGSSTLYLLACQVTVTVVTYIRLYTRYINLPLMYFWWSLCTMYLLVCQVRVITGLCCCVCVRRMCSANACTFSHVQ